jgi:hypothetical protein
MICLRFLEVTVNNQMNQQMMSMLHHQKVRKYIDHAFISRYLQSCDHSAPVQ